MGPCASTNEDNKKNNRRQQDQRVGEQRQPERQEEPREEPRQEPREQRQQEDPPRDNYPNNQENRNQPERRQDNREGENPAGSRVEPTNEGEYREDGGQNRDERQPEPEGDAFENKDKENTFMNFMEEKPKESTNEEVPDESGYNVKPVNDLYFPSRISFTSNS